MNSPENFRHPTTHAAPGRGAPAIDTAQGSLYTAGVPTTSVQPRDAAVRALRFQSGCNPVLRFPSTPRAGAKRGWL